MVNGVGRGRVSDDSCYSIHRQTDLIVAAARTGRVLHIKKGQWCHPHVMLAAADKARQEGNEQARGSEWTTLTLTRILTLALTLILDLTLTPILTLALSFFPHEP